MNAVSEVISNHRKLVSEVACLLYQLRVDCSRELHHYSQSYFCNSTWQGNSKLSIRIAQIVRSDHITPLNEFRRQIFECKAVYGLTDHLSLLNCPRLIL